LHETCTFESEVSAAGLGRNGTDANLEIAVPFREIKMSVSGISNVSLVNDNTQTTQSRMQQFRQVFQQLGQDLRRETCLPHNPIF
jgi:hypothetical protein